MIENTKDGYSIMCLGGKAKASIIELNENSEVTGKLFNILIYFNFILDIELNCNSFYFKKKTTAKIIEIIFSGLDENCADVIFNTVLSSHNNN